MITKAEFLRVQDLLGRGKSFSELENHKVESRPKFRSFTFAGCMTCAECGCTITAEIKTKRFKNGTAKHYTYYHCTHRKDKRGFRCPQREHIEERKLEGQISDIFSRIHIHSRFLKWAQEELKRRHAEEMDVDVSVSESINRSIKEEMKKRDRLMDAYFDGLIDRSQFEERRQEVDKSIENLQLRHKEAEERAKKWTGIMKRAFDYAACAQEAFQNGTREKKKSIFLALGSNRRFKGGRLYLDFHSWSSPFQKLGIHEDVESGGLEPKEKGSIKQIMEPFTDEKRLWLGIFDEVRNAILENPDQIYIPDLDE